MSVEVMEAQPRTAKQISAEIRMHRNAIRVLGEELWSLHEVQTRELQETSETLAELQDLDVLPAGVCEEGRTLASGLADMLQRLTRLRILKEN